MSAVAALGAAAGLAAALLLAAALYCWVLRPRTDIPGPATLPILGNLLFFRKLPIVYENFRKLQREYGNVARAYVGPVLFVMVTEAEDAQKLLAGSRIRDRGSYITQPLRPYMGNGLITSSGEVWKNHRKLIEPCFHSEVLKSFMVAFNEGADYICDYLRRARGSQVRLYHPLCLLSMRSLVASAFGVPFEEMAPDEDTQDAIAEAFIGGLKLFQTRIFRPWLQFDFVMRITGVSHKQAAFVNLTRDVAERGIAYKKMKKDCSESTKRKAVMDALLESELQITDEEIYDEIRTLLIAGTETTACGLGFALVLLSLHPEWQGAAHKELDDVFGNGEDYLRPSTTEDLAKLPIIDSIIKETLRLYPSVPHAPAVLSEDTPLSGGRYVAPKGTYAVVALYLLHRQPDVFPDPERFDPARFLDGGGPARHPYAYLPFGAGSRKCVGGRYSMLMMKTVLAAVLRRFRLRPGMTRQQLDHVGISISGVPLNDFKVTFLPRTYLPTRKAN